MRDSLRRVLFTLALTGVARPQSAVIDWSTVELDVDGRATFGPRVEVPEVAPPSFRNMTGYFANADGFYGRPGHVEYLHVRSSGEEERIEAMKLVGDHNVPRGRLTWRTAKGMARAPKWQMPIQLQLRDDIRSDDAFWWSPAEHEVTYEEDYTAFHLLGQNPSGAVRARFHRVTLEEADEAARLVADAP